MKTRDDELCLVLTITFILTALLTLIFTDCNDNVTGPTLKKALMLCSAHEGVLEIDPPRTVRCVDREEFNTRDVDNTVKLLKRVGQ